MAIKFLSSENIAGDIDVTLSKNGITYLAVTNTNNGASANARVQVVGESSQLDLVATSAGYTGVSGWADSGIISTDSGASGGLKLNSQAGGIQLQIGTTSHFYLATTGNVGINDAGAAATSLSVKDTQDSAFTSGISVIRSANSDVGYINMVGGAFNLNSTKNTKLRVSDATKLEVRSSGINVIGETETDTILCSGTATFTGQVTTSQPNSGLDYPILIGVGNSGSGVIGYQTRAQFNDIHNTVYNIDAANSSSSQWLKVGTLSNFGQSGYTFVLTFYGHTGYNASNTQDYNFKLFLKTSNGNAGGPHNAFFNTWVENTGNNTAAPALKWVNTNSSGTPTAGGTSFVLYMNVPQFVSGSIYTVDKHSGNWTSNNTTGQSDPGNDSTTVLQAENIFNILNTNVGIGTTSPDSKLDVRGTSSTPSDGNQTLSITNTTGGTQLNLGTIENTGGWIEAREGGTLRNLLLNPNGGNVGIGTESPGAKLHNYSTATQNVWISGYGTLAQNNWGAGHGIFAAQDNGLIISKANASNNTNRLFVFYHDSGGNGEQYIYDTNSTAKVKLDSAGDSYFNGGNLGIGTTSPAGKLQVVNNSQSTAALTVCNEANGGDGFVFQKWQYVESTSNFRLDLKQRVTSGVVQYAFDMVNNGVGYTSVLVLDRGNVGIGTTSPQYKLDVDGQIRAEGIVNIGGIGVSASGALANVDINDTDTNGTSTSYQPNITFKAAGTVKAQIGKLSGSTNYFTAAKNFDGPVNIIASEIHSGHTHSQEYIFGYEPANSGNTWGLNLVDGTNTANSIYIGAVGLNNTSSIFFHGYTNALCVTRISLNQSLGQWLFDAPDCGSSSTSVKWRKYNVGGYMQNMIDFEASGTINNATGSYGTISSDERVKENIVEATSKLDDILSLKVKNFNFIGDDKKQIGLIAQEVEEVFPSWVNTRDTRIYKTHDEDGNPLEEQGELVSGYEDGKSLKVGMEFAVLTKAIQELEARVKELENK